MTDAIILILVVLVLVFALKGTVKHFKGEGSCCGGGGSATKKEPPLKILEGAKLGEKVISISGMHCDHCVISVTKALNRIEGASAKVSLKRGEAVVSYDRTLDDESLKSAVETQGFQVREIRG